MWGSAGSGLGRDFLKPDRFTTVSWAQDRTAVSYKCPCQSWVERGPAASGGTKGPWCPPGGLSATGPGSLHPSLRCLSDGVWCHLLLPLLSLPGVSLVVLATLRVPGEQVPRLRPGPTPWAWHTAGHLTVPNPSLPPTATALLCLPRGHRVGARAGRAPSLCPGHSAYGAGATAHCPLAPSPCLPPGAPTVCGAKCGPSSGVGLHTVWLPRREK